MQYTFSVGQAVRAKSRFPGRVRAGVYRIVSLLPPADDEVPRYRVRSVEHGVEWVVAEEGIEASAGETILPGLLIDGPWHRFTS
jgi:hypothetical protein